MWSKTIANPSEVKFVFDALLSVSCNVVTVAVERICVQVLNEKNCTKYSYVDDVY
jgi:hypothetical protein